MNTNARCQIGQSCSFKEISLAIKLRSERQRVKEVNVGDEPEDNISHEDVFQKHSHEDIFKIVPHKDISKNFSRGCFTTNSHKDVSKKGEGTQSSNVI